MRQTFKQFLAEETDAEVEIYSGLMEYIKKGLTFWLQRYITQAFNIKLGEGDTMYAAIATLRRHGKIKAKGKDAWDNIDIGDFTINQRMAYNAIVKVGMKYL